jgi:pre-mRNA-processing factor 19
VFDSSGRYLAVGGIEATVYDVKKDWEVVKVWEVKKGPVTALSFAPDATALYLGAGDHNLRVYA